jgi:heat-inducible transcriptional repressor
MVLSDRQKLILHTLIKEYIKSAQPVASGILVEKYRLDISPATVRNELMFLEESGYIYQPHTSAGRVPTESAYILEIEALSGKKKELKGSDKEVIDRALDKSAESLKPVARALAELSGNAVFWAFHKNDLYHTGLSNLFAQPEFRQAETVCDVSLVIDRMEEIIDDLFNDLPEGSRIFLGGANPFGAFLGTSLLKYRYQGVSGLCGILGPLRMDYSRNLALLHYLQAHFK